MITSNKLRQKFIDYFVKRGHKELPPASLAPENDSSVLFTTAGMQQFKRFYLSPSEAPAGRVVTIQPCVRTSDIDEVGDATHLTFFEMLGNFSFGYPDKKDSYFKKEAIEFAWEFLTEVLKIDKKRISATYFKDDKSDIKEDAESLKILQNIEGLKIVKPQGFADNFWSLGTEGSPGGPTVEFYIDDLEVWNLVFNEYILKNSKYEPSKYRGVDTGMGLERLAMVLQGKESVFKIDEFNNLKTQIFPEHGIPQGRENPVPTGRQVKITSQNLKLKNEAKDLRIILDHLRTAEAMAGEGLIPSNKEQGFILRRLIRRMIVILKKYGFQIDNIAHNQIILDEAEKFRQTLERGLKVLTQLLKNGKLSGADAFDLFQSYGFPFELTQELAQEKNISIDKNEFQKEFTKHQTVSRASQEKFKGGLATGGEIETRYHTANHLLLASLRKILGEHIQQKGSNINSERLRFDFNHSEKMTETKIKQVEDLVIQKIQAGLAVKMEEMTLEEAKKSGATGVFDDRYGEKVKVYSILGKDGELFSREICGGPHVKNTKEIGKFKIIKEESSSAGIRRIRAKFF